VAGLSRLWGYCRRGTERLDPGLSCPDREPRRGCLVGTIARARCTTRHQPSRGYRGQPPRQLLRFHRPRRDQRDTLPRPHAGGHGPGAPATARAPRCRSSGARHRWLPRRHGGARVGHGVIGAGGPARRVRSPRGHERTGHRLEHGAAHGDRGRPPLAGWTLCQGRGAGGRLGRGPGHRDDHLSLGHRVRRAIRPRLHAPTPTL